MPISRKNNHSLKQKGLACVASTALTFSASLVAAGDFGNPTPFSLSTDAALRAALENSRISLSAALGSSYYQLGDYYERYQANTNWNNAVLSGNTIILNGDNNVVTLSTDGATIEQSSTDTCQSGSGEMIEGTDATASVAVDCGD